MLPWSQIKVDGVDLRLLASGAVQLEGDICKTPDSAGSGNFLISPVASADGNSV